MKFTILALLFVVPLIFVLAEGEAPSDVVVLTDSTFKDAIQKGDYLVEFYAPWCGFCKKLAPTYEKIASQLKGKVNVAKVDCTVESSVASAFDIKGYPTIKFVTKDGVYEYNGDRSEENLIEFANGGYKTGVASPLPQLGANADESSGPSDVIVLTDSNFDDLTSKGDWLLEFYAPWCGHCKKLAPTYEKLATSLKGKVNVGKVDCTVNNALARRFAIKGYPTIKLYKEGQGKVWTYSSERTVEALTAFVTDGYTSVTDVAPFPPKPTQSQVFFEKVNDAVRSVESELAKKVWISLAVAFVLGVILGKLLFGGSSSGASSKPHKD